MISLFPDCYKVWEALTGVLVPSPSLLKTDDIGSEATRHYEVVKLTEVQFRAAAIMTDYPEIE